MFVYLQPVETPKMRRAVEWMREQVEKAARLQRETGRPVEFTVEGKRFDELIVGPGEDEPQPFIVED